MRTKRFTLALLTALLTLAAHAVPAIPTPMTLPQSDGTSITVNLLGDEWQHCFTTADGLTLTRAANGDFYYRTPAGGTAIRAHNAAERTAAEMTFIAANAAQLTTEAVMGPSVNATAAKRARANAPRRATQVPQSGSPRIPIILVNYSDITFRDSNPVATFENQFNTKAKSCLQYFNDQSRGSFTPQFDILGPVDLDNDRAHYGSDISEDDHDQKIGNMVAEAVKTLTSTDFSVYDNDGDGAVDVVIILYAGVGQASSGLAESIWPCQWNLSSAYYYGHSDYNSFKQNGKTINKFAVFNELLSGRIDGIGTFCHEFSHCLGLPDYYETTYTYGYFGMSYWSLMNSGCYLDNGDTPCGYSAYDRNFMGWFTFTNPVENTQYSLDALNTDTGTAVKVVNNADRNEYYVLENRQKTGWDAYLPSHGMMVNHVTYNATAWNSNTVNNSSLQRMTIIPADGVLSTSTLSGDLYPNGGRNTSLTDNSSPAATVNTGSYMSKPITNITEKNSKITFWYMRGTYIKDIPEMEEATDVTTDGFTARWNNVQNVSYFTMNVTSSGDKTASYSRNFSTGTDTLCIVSGLEEGGTYTAKVRVRYTDGTDSDWSDPITVTLDEYAELYPVSEASITNDGFTASWKPLKNVVSYTLKVVRADLPNYILLQKETFANCTANATTNIGTTLDNYLDNPGWTGSRVFQIVGGVRLGLTTNTSGGALKSPDLDLTDSDGKMTVVVTAKPYNTATSTVLVVTNGTETQNITINGEETLFVSLDCDITETGYVTLGSTSKKPVVLTYVAIYAGEVTPNDLATAPRKVTVKGDSQRMTISDITDTFYTVTGLTAGMTYNFKVRGIADDGTEGDWSPMLSVDLPGGNVPGDVNADGIVDVLDANIVVGIVLGSITDSTLKSRADLNGDGTVDVIDLNILISLILAS